MESYDNVSNSAPNLDADGESYRCPKRESDFDAVDIRAHNGTSHRTSDVRIANKFSFIGSVGITIQFPLIWKTYSTTHHLSAYHL